MSYFIATALRDVRTLFSAAFDANKHAAALKRLDNVLAKQHRRVFALLMAVSFILRLPFFFISTDGYLHDTSASYHDEAVYMQAGSLLLSGELPYLQHWDVLPPLGWVVWAFLMLISAGNLVMLRIIASVCVCAVGYMCYRILADCTLRMRGVVAGILYVLFASSLQASQSFTHEQLIAVPVSIIIYLLVHPKYARRQVVLMCALFTVCVMLQYSMVVLALAIALLYAPLYSEAIVLVGEYSFYSIVARIRIFLMRVLLLFAALTGAYAVLILLYAAVGHVDVLLRTLIDAPQGLFGRPLSVVAFLQRYWWKLAALPQWLLAFSVLVFIGGCVTHAVRRMLRGHSTFAPVLQRMCAVFVVMLVAVFFTLYLRGSHGALFPFYLLQVLPIFIVILVMCLGFDYGQLKWFVIVVFCLGIVHATGSIAQQYGKLWHYAGGDSRYASSFFGDRLYETAKVMSPISTTSEALLVCGEDDMLYPLTGMRNPNYFLFPFYPYNHVLHRHLKQPFDDVRKVAMASKPLFIIGRSQDRLTRKCLRGLGDVIERYYTQIATVDGTMVFIRRTELMRYDRARTMEHVP